MRHMLDRMPQQPSIIEADVRRAEINQHVAEFLARGGQIQRAESWQRGDLPTKGLDEYIAKDKRISLAMLAEAKFKPASLYKPTKKHYEMTLAQRVAFRKAASLERMSKPCPRVWDGVVCGGTQYVDRGACKACKKQRERRLYERKKQEAQQC